MYIPSGQSILTAGLALSGTLTKRSSSSPFLSQSTLFPLITLSILLSSPPSLLLCPYSHERKANKSPASEVSSGKILDFAVEKCIDKDGNQRCTKPFLVTKSTCYEIKWSTEGTVSHTTVEVRDAGSDELVYYRDTDGEWTPEKGELVYMDFKPKVWKTGNDTVEYTVKTCE